LEPCESWGAGDSMGGQGSIRIVVADEKETGSQVRRKGQLQGGG